MPRANLITDERQATRASRDRDRDDAERSGCGQVGLRRAETDHAEGLGDSRPEAEGHHRRLPQDRSARKEVSWPLTAPIFVFGSGLLTVRGRLRFEWIRP